MTVKEIIRQQLEKNGHDGLCLPGLECACGLDNLMECRGDSSECQPARLISKERMSSDEFVGTRTDEFDEFYEQVED